MRFLHAGLLLTFRQARRAVLVVIGFSVLLFGIALLVLPGPAFLVIPAGLGILSVEFAWARRWLNRIRTTAEAAARKIRGQAEPVNSTR
jgi:tellurite resistance protein TerC